jgi:hypothetical protein
MQTVVLAICVKGKSLREAIASDKKLVAYDLEVSTEKKSGRSPGWTKVVSKDPSRNGAINIEWNGATSVLECRVVNRGKGRPNRIVGDFVDYLLFRHAKRIRVVSVVMTNR